MNRPGFRVLGISRSRERTSWIGLAYELIHADHVARRIPFNRNGATLLGIRTEVMQTATENRRELTAVGIGELNTHLDITENDIRREPGLRVRSAY